MRHRLLHLIALLAAGSLFVAACSDDDGGTTAPAGNEPGANRETPTEIDRSGPLRQARLVLRSPARSPKAAPKAIDDGITADAVTVTHIRVKLEELAGLGFAVDIGDPNDSAQTFVDLINDRCGGIHGRKIDLQTVEVPALPSGGQDTSSVAQAACIEAAEDQNAVFAFSSSGFGNVGVPCLTQAHEVIFITSYTFSGEDTKQAESRLYSTGLSGEEQLTYMARDLAKRGALDGKTIGVVRPDLIPDADIVERGLVDVLKDELGLDVKRVDTIGCGGGNQCADRRDPARCRG